MILLLLAACASPKDSGLANEGPVLAHSPPSDLLTEGDLLALTGTATDDDGVAVVTVEWRTSGASAWESLTAELSGASLVDATWTATVPAVAAPGVEYRIRARDTQSPSASSTLPEDGAFTLPVQVATRAVPFAESFEDAASLSALGWLTPSQAFAGQPWDLTAAHHSDGAQSAVHLRGGQAVGVLQDWLVSPPLDLSDQADAMVHWQERGANVEQAVHALYVSTGSRDPADGDFVRAATLDAPPDGDWARATPVDLSAWAGQSPVTLGWYTEGQAADDWWIDDVRVGPLDGDLVDPVLSWSPDPAAPGDTVTVEISVDNALDAALDGVVATLSLPDGGGTLGEPTADLGTVAGLGRATGSWTLEIDGDHPDHSYLPLALQLDSGDRSWVFDDLAMVVGLPSTGRVDLSLDATGAVTVELRRGPLDAPTLTVPVAEEVLDAGAHALSVDLTPYSAALPAAAGPDARWHAFVLASSDGDLDAVSLEHAGTLQEATVLEALYAGNPVVAWIPEPPEPSVVDAVLDPALTPGATGVALSLHLRNRGASTAGPVTMQAWSDDPDLVVHGGEARTLLDRAWTPGLDLDVDGLTLDVSADHRDSTPVTLSLGFDDGVDDIVVPLVLDVPWPRFTAGRVDVDDGLAADTGAADSGGLDTGPVGVGNGDGRVDAGETVVLTLTVSNVGSADAFAPILARAALSADSEVPAEVDGTLVELPVLAAGEQTTWELVVQAGEGGVGEELVLELTLDDGTASWVETLSIPLSEAPWFVLTPFEDAAGDVLDAGAVDLRNARYRVVDDTLQLEVLGWEDFDAETAFVEIWGRSSASTYLYHRIISQPGGIDLDGYLSGSGFLPLPAPTRSQPDPRTLHIDLPLADLELATDSLRIGIAAGWCGPDEYFCDHHPDGWGYPYVGFSSGEFIEMRW
ncbi:MAG: choice-of-anchor J domain-containing protein [Alphaproteobacteria bacterium]|nr:choice-of-anchor J domain-containing protein [Alphaproteobacteria bacterium]